LDPDPDPYWPPPSSSGSGSVKNEYGSTTLEKWATDPKILKTVLLYGSVVDPNKFLGLQDPSIFVRSLPSTRK
jgi:hypothetical protein